MKTSKMKVVMEKSCNLEIVQKVTEKEMVEVKNIVDTSALGQVSLIIARPI